MASGCYYSCYVYSILAHRSSYFEQAHKTLNLTLEKQKEEELGYPHESLAQALYVLNFLNCNEIGQTAYERQYSFDAKAHLKPPVMVKDLVNGEWKGPLDLVTWGWGHACVSTGHQVEWILSGCVQPFVAPS